MADIDVWGLSAIGSPAAADRIPIATGSGAGGYSLRGSFSWRTAGNYLISSGTTFAATVPTAGTVDGAHSQWLTNGFNTAYGLSIGVAGSGNSWLQCQRNDGAGTLYNLLLNPLGGNVGIGTAAPAVRFHVKSSGEIARLETTTARGGGNGFLSWYDPTGRKGQVGYADVSDHLSLINNLSGLLYFGTNGTGNWQIATAGHFQSMSDNALDMGGASNRIRVVYAGTGTINTSDEREKTWRGAPTKAELKAATRIIGELGFYQWNDAVAAKGDDARYHFGVRAQRVWAIMAEEKLVAPIGKSGKPGRTPYAFLCFDEWKADKDAGIEAGNRYGLRTDQLILFLMAAQQEQIVNQEARLAALEAAL